MTLPEVFIEKMSQLLGTESDCFFQTYKQKRTFGLRVNTLKTGAEPVNFLPLAFRRVPFCQTGYYYNEADTPGKHPLHQAGLYYVQEPSAMFVAEALAARPGERVLDLCAAPGGKATQIAASMKNTGLLIANEINPKRVRALSENMERMGVTNALVLNESPEHLADYFPGYFDRILVDAPCSGEGMFRKDPEAAQYWSTDHVRQCAALQRQILDQAYIMLRQGGRLVYSTCTFSPEEDEQQIEALLKKYPDLELLPIDKANGIEDGRPQWTASKNAALGRTARLWPHRLRGEGHFVASLLKQGEAVRRRMKSVQSVKEGLLKDFRDFESRTLTEKTTGTFFFIKDQLFLLPEGCPSFDKLRVVRPGLHLGMQKKNRFEPNHSLALARSTAAFRNLLPLRSSDSDWGCYLRGETLPTPKSARGWIIVTIDGFPLGWGKASGGILKNFYPKGLRRRSLNH